jgi:DNA-binding MarR family transcriptional regulator
MLDRQPMPAPSLNEDTARRIAAIRRFNRFYTKRIGVLREGLSQTRFSLTEARVLYELAQRDTVTASELAADLAIDPGYLSRIIQGFERDGLLTRTPAQADRRQVGIALSDAGRAAFAPLDDRARQEAALLLSPLPYAAQTEIVDAMARIEALLGSGTLPDWHTRLPAPGDIGWVVERHGALYAAEYGFDHRFEALVGKVASAFLAGHDPARERCWIAERGGLRLGSVFVVREAGDVARIRLLIVEPAARGLGIGRRLVADCIDFARAAGYRRITLWTNDVLVAARAIYAAAGFRLVASKAHSDFGPAIVGEDWELDLSNDLPG